MSANFVTDSRPEEPNERTSLMCGQPAVVRTVPKDHDIADPMQTASPAHLLTANGDAAVDQDLSASTFENEVVSLKRIMYLPRTITSSLWYLHSV